MAFWEGINLTAIDWGSIVHGIVIWFEFVFGLVILGLLGMVFFQLSQYNKMVLVAEEREGGRKYSFAKAKKTKIGDGYVFELLEGSIFNILRRKKPIVQLPPANSLLGIKGKKDFMMLLKVGENQYRYETINTSNPKESIIKKTIKSFKTKISDDEKDKIINETRQHYAYVLSENPKPKINTIDQDVLDWHFRKQKELLEKHMKPSFMEKYGNYVLMSFTIGICFIMVIYALDKMGGVSGACEVAKQNILDVARQKLT